MAEAPVTLKNLKEYQDALKVIDPTLARELQRELKRPAQSIAAASRDEAPPGPIMGNFGRWRRGADGFDMSYERGQVQRGILVTSARSRITGSSVGASSALKMVQRNPVGIIYEKAGERGGSGTAFRRSAGGGVRKVNWPQSRTFVRVITADYSPAPRLLLRVWRREKGITKTAAAAHRVAERTIEEVEKRLK